MNVKDLEKMIKDIDTQPAAMLNDNFLVLPDKIEDKKTASGLFIPTTENNKRIQTGTIICNEENVDENSRIFSDGTKVAFRRFGGEEFTIDGVEYLVISAKDLVAVV